MAFDNARAGVGIEGLVPLRVGHTASLAIRAGTNVELVQKVRGHATVAMHLLNVKLSGVADELGRTVDGTAPFGTLG